MTFKTGDLLKEVQKVFVSNKIKGPKQDLPGEENVGFVSNKIKESKQDMPGEENVGLFVVFYFHG
jgi:hypothetical protein